MNCDRITQIGRRMALLLRDVNSRLRGLKLRSEMLVKRSEMEILISRLEDITRQFVRSHEAWLHRKENLEAGRLTENLLPPSVLESILTSERQQGQPIRPLQ